MSHTFPGGSSISTSIGGMSLPQQESWIVWDYGNEGSERAVAWFPSEIEALRYAVTLGYYVRVARIQPGEISEQLRTDAS